MPEGIYEVIFCMGVMEYLDQPLELLLHAINNSTYVIFSYNGFTSEERRILQGWRNNLTFFEIEHFIIDNNARVLVKKHIENNEWIYLVKRQI